jgi:hypothetical protein
VEVGKGGRKGLLMDLLVMVGVGLWEEEKGRRLEGG